MQLAVLVGQIALHVVAQPHDGGPGRVLDVGQLVLGVIDISGVVLQRGLWVLKPTLRATCDPSALLPAE